MTESGVRLDDIVLGPADEETARYRARVHPADVDDLDTLIELADVPGVYTIVQIPDDEGWRLVEHRAAGKTPAGHTVFERWDVTDRELTRDRSAQAEGYRDVILRSGLQAVAVIDPGSLRIKYVTDQVAAMLDEAAESLIGSRAHWHVDRRDLPRLRRLLQRVAIGLRPDQTELRIRRPGLGPRWMEVTFADTAPVGGAGEDSVGVVIALRDIHHRIEAERRLRSSEHLFRILVDQVGDGVVVLDQDLRMAFLSSAAATVLGGTVEDLTGRIVPLRCGSGELELLPTVADNHLPPLDLLPAEVRCPSGRWFDLVGHDLRDDPVVAGWVLVLRDVTERRDRVETLRHQLELDPLTELLNRRGFERQVATQLDAGLSVGIGFLDLDGFKQVNDDHGHAVGDALLVEIAQRLRRGVRPGDVVARFGGDEFAIAFIDLPDDDRIEQLTTRLRAATGGAYRVEGVDVQVGASVGWTVVTAGETLDDALRRADELMYEQKRQRP